MNGQSQMFFHFSQIRRPILPWQNPSQIQGLLAPLQTQTCARLRQRAGTPPDSIIPTLLSLLLERWGYEAPYRSITTSRVSNNVNSFLHSGGPQICWVPIMMFSAEPPVLKILHMVVTPSAGGEAERARTSVCRFQGLGWYGKPTNLSRTELKRTSA